MDMEILRSEAQKALEESGILARALEAAGRMAGAYEAFKAEWGKLKHDPFHGQREEPFIPGFLSDAATLRKEVEARFLRDMQRIAFKMLKMEGGK